MSITIELTPEEEKKLREAPPEGPGRNNLRPWAD